MMSKEKHLIISKTPESLYLIDKKLMQLIKEIKKEQSNCIKNVICSLKAFLL